MILKDFFDDSALSTLKKNLQEAEDKIISRIDNHWSDEDVITGAFNERLLDAFEETTLQNHDIQSSMHKLRGRGANAPEKKYGADSVLTTTVLDEKGRPVFSKTLPIQSKKDEFNRKDLGQLEKMNSVIGSGSGLVYNKDSFQMDSASSIIEGNYGKNKKKASDFIVDDFIECKTGVKDLLYDPTSEQFRFILNSNNLLNIFFIPKGYYLIPWDIQIPKPLPRFVTRKYFNLIKKREE